MKKNIFYVSFLFLVTFTTANASVEYPTYPQYDYCGSYYYNCSAVVIKCSFVGTDYCIYPEISTCERECF